MSAAEVFLTREEWDKMRAEIERLRAALEEIAHHYIDSQFASKEKRRMAQRALNEQTGIKEGELWRIPKEDR